MRAGLKIRRRPSIVSNLANPIDLAALVMIDMLVNVVMDAAIMMVLLVMLVLVLMMLRCWLAAYWASCAA